MNCFGINASVNYLVGYTTDENGKMVSASFFKPNNSIQSLPEIKDQSKILVLGNQEYSACCNSMSYFPTSFISSSSTLTDVYIYSPFILCTDIGTSNQHLFTKCKIHVPCEIYEDYMNDIRVRNGGYRGFGLIGKQIQGIPSCETIPPTINIKYYYIYNNGSYRLNYSEQETVLWTSDVNLSNTTPSAMTSAYIGDSVTAIADEAFWKGRSITSITLSENITSIGYAAFHGCSGLTNFTCLATTPPTIGRNVFSSSSLKIYVPAESVDIYKSSTGWSDYADKIEAIPYVPTPTSTTKIQAYYSNGTNYYKYCNGSTTLTYEETHPSGYEYTAMTSVVIGDCVTSIAGMDFSNCTSLTSVTIPSGVTNIGNHVFYICSSLTSVTVNATIPPSLGQYVFYKTNNCPIYVPAESVDAYKSASGWSDLASRIQPIT